MRPLQQTNNVKPGDLVVSSGIAGVILWPDYQVVQDPDNPTIAQSVHLLGEAGPKLTGLALVIAVLEWPEMVDVRIILLLFGYHLGYNRELFLKVVE